MKVDLELLRQQISDGTITLEGSTNVIKTGTLIKNDASTSNFFISYGWDIVASNLCDKEWKKYKFIQFETIKNLGLSPEKEKEILLTIKYEDDHWDWFKKSCAFASSEYEWFYLFADDKPQGVCVIFHPKASAISSGDIFYIEYLAVAPWNRNDGLHTRIYKGIGSILIDTVQKYAIDVLKYRPGFCLHSLPQAATYYRKIGMEYVAKEDKDRLQYFEMREENSISFSIGAK